MLKRHKIFLDTSVLLSGLNSPQGASGIIISLFRIKKIDVVISPEVKAETERVIRRKFPDLGGPFIDFMSHNPDITKTATTKEIRIAYKQISSEDAPIFAGAVKSKAPAIVTLDKKFKELISRSIKIKALTPGEFLASYRKPS